MTVLIQDTARNNLASWAHKAVQEDLASGAVISPFTSPTKGNGYKIDVEKVVERIQEVGGTVWFDPTTHGLQMPDVGDFRYYDQWDLWRDEKNALDTISEQRDHVSRVMDIQTRLNVPFLSPTILLHSAQSLTSQRAIDMAGIAKDLAGNNELWISIVGDAHFWSSGAELDAHIGALDQLEPTGWFLTVARPQSMVPAPASPEEVHGIMRSVYALSQDTNVIVAHSDLAGLPAVAAGASSIGTGWDIRQRVCAYTDYAARVESTGGGQWYKRPTLELLLGNMSENEYAVLRSEAPQLSELLTPGSINKGAQNAFHHHLSVLTRISTELLALSGRDRIESLRGRYATALKHWDRAQEISGSVLGGRQWVESLQEGVELFTRSEGWSL